MHCINGVTPEHFLLCGNVQIFFLPAQRFSLLAPHARKALQEHPSELVQAFRFELLHDFVVCVILKGGALEKVAIWPKSPSDLRLVA